MAPTVGLIALSTASPTYELPRKTWAPWRAVRASRFPGFARMASVFRTTGIRTRQAVMPIEWYLERRGWPERTAAYLSAGVDLFVEAAQGALYEALVTVQRIRELVIARANTRRLMRRGGFEVRRRALSTDPRIARGVAGDALGHGLEPPRRPGLACGLRKAAGAAHVDAGLHGPALDDPDHRRAGETPVRRGPIVSSYILTIWWWSARSPCCRWCSGSGASP